MGLTCWYFLRPRPGELRPAMLKSFEAFFQGDGSLQAGEDGIVRYVQVIVELQDRRPMQVLQTGFFQTRTREDGTLDREHHAEILAAAGDAAFGGFASPFDPPGVVQAAHRFARRRLHHLNHWKPEEADLLALREVVNTRARAAIM